MIERMADERGVLNACLCGCGDLVAGSWKRGHAARGVGGYRAGPAPLPPPGAGVPDDLEGLDNMEPVDPGPSFNPFAFTEEPPEVRPRADGMGPPLPGPSDAGPFRELPADPPPARIKAAGGRGTKAPKVTAAVRSDVEGKLGIVLHMSGTVWAARDPVCGGAYLAQLPAIRPAMAELILMSPDLVQWFTGVGGGFMLWFQLAAACWPVLATIWAHHGPGAAGQDAYPADAQQPQQAFAA
jgi:hypothetical protein